jgi:ATP-dependent Clp protease ATP-binding subunit ClpA
VGYTVDAARVISAALRSALARQAPQLGTTGLLLALVSATDTALAAEIEKNLPGLGAAVRSHLSASTGRSTERGAEPDRLVVPYSVNLRAALDAAASIGESRQGSSVQSADLLLGLLDQPRAGAVALVRRCGLDPDDLRRLCELMSQLELEAPAEYRSASASTSLTVPSEWARAEPREDS